jgi:hypothetical protein
MTDAGRPKGWGRSELTRFLDLVLNNQLATFEGLPNFTALLEHLDEAFHRAATNLSDTEHVLVPSFLLRAHSSYRAACATAMAGQAAETFVLVRSILEYAGYGLLIAKRPEAETMWIKRHASEEAMKAMKKTFTVANIKKAIAEADEREAVVFDALYQRSIDFGAHPNERAVASNMAIRKEQDAIVMRQEYLSAGGTATIHAMKTVAQAGVCTLRVFSPAFAERFKKIGVATVLEEIPKRWNL